ncbi:hypothetical protein EJB05_43007 [Eragrostis curvula]|uniref:DRBM domain-containing protein n=1 Tax=Eragrostis curvula TaxID=38414 RepID=A0A5J9TDU0_9POAL|nr:hypothetical protein EJB05_43007 [Eragrostis curvula]
MDNKSNALLVDASEKEVGLKEEKDLFVSCKRTKISGSIVQQQQGVEASDKENKVPDALVHKVSVGMDAMNRPTDSEVKSTGEANGCSKGNEPARSKLQRICSAYHIKGPLYDFKEQGPPRNKLFTCKVTIHVDSIVNTVVECFSDPKPQKKAAQEHAAQGAVWCLAHYGYVK